MNISLVCGFIEQKYGGIPKVALSMADQLGQMGHTIEGWATSGSELDSLLKDKGIWHLFPKGYPKSWFYSKEFSSGLNRSINDYDLVHMLGTWNYPVYTGSKISRRNSIPYIISPHGGVQGWRVKQKYWKKKLYLELIMSKNFKGAACLHAINPIEANFIRKIGYKGEISVITNGIDLKELSSGFDFEGVYSKWPALKNKKIILYMSRISPEKGLDILMPAWKEHLSHMKDADEILVLAGPDDRGYTKVVESMIEGNGLSSTIILPGIVRGAVKNALLKLADYFVLPSYSENFGLVVGEALAVETPVITTTGTPWAQLDDLGAGYCIPPKKGNLVDALDLMSNHSSSQKSIMGKIGAEHIAKNYSWNSVCHKYSELYESIINTGKGTSLYEG